MKKRLLLTLFLSVVLCTLLSFAVGAQEYPLVDNLGTPDWYTGNYELMTDKTSQVVLSNGDGSYTAYPAYYILKYDISVNGGAVTSAKISGFDYSFVNTKASKNYEAGAIYKIEVPNGITIIENGYFGHKPKEPNVVELVMPDSVTTISDHALRETTNMKRVVLSKNLTKLGGYAFYNAKGLEEVVFPEGSKDELDVSGANIFVGCSSLKELDLSKKNIKALGTCFLDSCTSLGKLTLPDTLEHIGYCSIYRCPNLYLASDFLPKSLKTAGFHFMSGCKSINKVLYFPDGFEGFTADYNFSDDKEKAPDLTLVFLGKMSGTMNFQQLSVNSGRKLTFIFTKNQFSDLSGKIVQASNDGALAYIAKTADTSDTDYWVQEGTLTISLGNAGESHSKYKVDENGNTLYYINSRSYNIFFCGGDDVEVCYGIRGNIVNSEWGKQFTTPFTFDRQGHMDKGIHYDLTEVVSLVNCGFDGVTTNTCVLCSRVEKDIVPATGDHDLYDVSVCADKCSVCLLYVQKAEQSHSCVETFTYENGFTSLGFYSNKCQNEGCDINVEKEMAALIVDLGYSVPETKRTGITFGFKTEYEVAKVYERVNGCKLKLGTLVALGENFAKNEKIIDVIFAEDVEFVEALINYGDTTEHMDKMIVMAGIISISDENGTSRTYFQSKTDKETVDYTSQSYGTLYGISYNILAAK